MFYYIYFLPTTTMSSDLKNDDAIWYRLNDNVFVITELTSDKGFRMTEAFCAKYGYTLVCVDGPDVAGYITYINGIEHEQYYVIMDGLYHPCYAKVEQLQKEWDSFKLELIDKLTIKSRPNGIEPAAKRQRLL